MTWSDASTNHVLALFFGEQTCGTANAQICTLHSLAGVVGMHKKRHAQRQESLLVSWSLLTIVYIQRHRIKPLGCVKTETRPFNLATTGRLSDSYRLRPAIPCSGQPSRSLFIRTIIIYPVIPANWQGSSLCSCVPPVIPPIRLSPKARPHRPAGRSVGFHFPGCPSSCLPCLLRQPTSM